MTEPSHVSNPAPQPAPAPRLLDARAWNGPWCLLKVGSFFARLRFGEFMEVLVSDPGAARDLPRLLHAAGGVMVSAENQNGHQRLIFERRTPQTSRGCCAPAAEHPTKQGERHVPGT